MKSMTGYYRFADLTFRITGDEARMFRDEGVLEPFRVEGPAYDHSLRYEVVDSLPLPEGQCIYRGPRIQVFRQEGGQLICRGDTTLLPGVFQGQGLVFHLSDHAVDSARFVRYVSFKRLSRQLCFRNA